MFFSPPPQSSIPYLGFVMGRGHATLKPGQGDRQMAVVADEVGREIRRLAPNYVSIDTAPGVTDMRPFMWNGYGLATHFNYVIDLEKPLDILWKDFGKDCKERIRAFGKGDVSLKASGDVDTYYRLVTKMYADQGLNAPILSKDYLKEIFRRFPENLKFYYLLKDGEVVDIEAAYAYKDKYKLLWCVSSIQKKMYGNQEFSTWDLIKKAKENGHREFEIVGANVRRFCQYQAKFNPALDMCFTIYRKDARGAAAEWLYANMIRKRHLTSTG